jgi:hypothetical protein
MIKHAPASLIAAVLLLTSASAVRAEGPPHPYQARTAAQMRASVDLRPTVPTAHFLTAPAVTNAELPKGGQKRTGAVLMIVGAAGLVTGLIVDEPIVTIAGAGVGGYGLYLYLK